MTFPDRTDFTARFAEFHSPAEPLAAAAYWHDLERRCRTRTLDAMEAARAAGASYRAIGAAMGVDGHTVQRALARRARRQASSSQ